VRGIEWRLLARQSCGRRKFPRATGRASFRLLGRFGWEDERGRLVEIAEAAYEELDERKLGSEPEERERVRAPDHDWVAG
jgi:hypothetical protein